MAETPLFPSRFRLFRPILAGATATDRAAACLGAMVGIALTAFVGAWALGSSAPPFLVAPMGASAVLMFAVPASPLAQPWPVLGGNILSALIGVLVARLVPDQRLAAGVAVAAAIGAMSLARCLHPPGGAAALLPLLGGPAVQDAGWRFALLPVGLNAALLVAAGLLFHRFSGHSYPHRPVPVVGQALPTLPEPGFAPEDLGAALAELGESFDIAREDLDLLLQLAERHAADRRAAQ